MKIKTILVEDNKMDALLLEQYCSYDETIEVVDKFTNGKDAIKYLSSNKVDLMFLDIEMPNMTGLEVMDQKVAKNHEKRNSVAISSAHTEMYVKSDGKFIRIPYSEVLYFENVGDYIKVITSNGMHIIYGALKALAEKLSYPRFLKVHRSFIVNLDKIIDIEDNSLVIGQKVIPISRAHKPIIMNSINII